MTLGQQIGRVGHVFSVTNDAGEKIQLDIVIDFSLASNADIKGWLASNRVIAGQRPWRALSAKEIKALNYEVFLANDVGKKIKSREERMAIYTTAGFPEDLAALAVDRPDLLQKVNVEGLVDEDPHGLDTDTWKETETE